MSSRDKILAQVRNNQPEPRALPELPGAGRLAGAGGLAGVGRLAGAGVPAGVGRLAGAGVPAGAGGLAGAGGPAGAELAPAFAGMVESIGGTVYMVSGFDRIATMLHEQHAKARRIVTRCPELAGFAEEGSRPAGFAEGDSRPTGFAEGDSRPDGFAGTGSRYDDPHTLANVELAVIPALFGVAENGACWVTEKQLGERALPFIAQHLALVVRQEDIVADMHAAYERIAAIEAGAGVAGRDRAAGSYGFATFIAGPSKTADIEQSLVLGAHGPVSLTVFLLDEQLSDAGFY